MHFGQAELQVLARSVSSATSLKIKHKLGDAKTKRPELELPNCLLSFRYAH